MQRESALDTNDKQDTSSLAFTKTSSTILFSVLLCIRTWTVREYFWPQNLRLVLQNELYNDCSVLKEKNWLSEY